MELFAIIDIMGYRSSVQDGKIDMVTESIRDVIKSLSLFFNNSVNDLKWELYSDSIFICKSIDCDDDILKFFKCMQMIASCAFAGKYSERLPYKGGVSMGEILYREEVLCAKVGDVKTGMHKRVSYFIGSPVAIAYELQEKIDFFGISIHESTIKLIKTNHTNAWQQLVNTRIIDEVMVPLKNQNGCVFSKEHVINFVDGIIMPVMGVWFYLEPRHFHGNDKVRKKYENTWMVASQLIANERIHAIAKDSALTNGGSGVPATP
jgi:hypothetical protein